MELVFLCIRPTHECKSQFAYLELKFQNVEIVYFYERFQQNEREIKISKATFEPDGKFAYVFFSHKLQAHLRRLALTNYG